jgi:hypothetical protein
MTLAQRDIYLVRIETEMNKKKQFLLQKYKTLGEMEEDNEYLRLLRNDYQHYYDYIQKEKQEQIDAMNMIKDHIDNLILEGHLTDEDLENTQNEQEKILDEIDNIKNSLDEITDNYPQPNVLVVSEEENIV